RVFQLGWTSDDDYDELCRLQCHLNAHRAHELVARMPRLEELYLFAHAVDVEAVFGMDLPNLRTLQIYHSYRCPLEVLAANPAMSRLERLLLHPHALEPEDRPYVNLEGGQALAAAPDLDALR